MGHVRGRRGQIPLWVMVILAVVAAGALGVWTYTQTSDVTHDGRLPIVFWGSNQFGEDIYTVVHQFEKANPQYKVIMGTAAARDVTGDAQRLLSAVAGGVPPDVVVFDRFAIGEWAARGALTDMRPFLDAQPKDDPYRINLDEFYEWAVSEAMYAPPRSNEPPGIFGIPTTADIRVLYSNADLLRQEGLVDAQGNPRPPRTWDELREYANRLTRFQEPGNRTSGITRLGFAPNFGNSWLYLYAWQAGGEFLDPTRTRVTMDSPPVVRALQFMVDVYDDLGGFPRVSAFESSFQGGELDPFLRGQLAMKIDGDWALAAIADWRRDMDFLVTPAPMPADQLAAGRDPVTWAGGFSMVIPATAHNPEGAFKLIQYLSSWEVTRLLEQGKREQRESQGRLYMPRALGNRVQYERLIEEMVEGNPDLPPRFREAYAVLRQMMPNTLIRPVTPVGQLLWNQHIRAYDAAVNHVHRPTHGDDHVRHSLATMQVDVQRQLDRALQPPPPDVVNWKPYFVAYILLLIAPFGLMAIVYRRRRRIEGYRGREVGAALLFASPWFIGFAVFVGGPILFSIVFSFTQYDVLSEARYVGLDNYRDVFADSVFYKSVGNTLFMIIRIPLVMAVGLAIAMLLNQQIGGMGFYRTAFYMPAIVPLVAASLLWVWLFNPAHGALNSMLNWLFDTFPFEWLEAALGYQLAPPSWLQDANWSKPSLILMNLWGAGGGMIIWLAGLQSIPRALYEAAAIDGAGPWRRFTNVTLPMLSPYILFNLIIGLIGTMQIFGEAYIMTEGGPADSTLFYAYYLFKQAFQYFRMGYASALAWILFIAVLVLTLLQLWLSKKWVHYEQA